VLGALERGLAVALQPDDDVGGGEFLRIVREDGNGVRRGWDDRPSQPLLGVARCPLDDRFERQLGVAVRYIEWS
jgi:hypothetical protein